MLNSALLRFTEVANQRDFREFNRKIDTINLMEPSEKHKIISVMLIVAIRNEDKEFFNKIIAAVKIFKRDDQTIRQSTVVSDVMKILIKTNTLITADMTALYIPVYYNFISWEQEIKRTIKYQNYQIMELLLSKGPKLPYINFLDFVEKEDNIAQGIIRAYGEPGESFNFIIPQKGYIIHEYTDDHKLKFTTMPLTTGSSSTRSDIKSHSSFIGTIKPTLSYGETDSNITELL